MTQCSSGGTRGGSGMMMTMMMMGWEVGQQEFQEEEIGEWGVSVMLLLFMLMMLMMCRLLLWDRLGMTCRCGQGRMSQVLSIHITIIIHKVVHVLYLCFFFARWRAGVRSAEQKLISFFENSGRQSQKYNFGLFAPDRTDKRQKILCLRSILNCQSRNKIRTKSRKK